MSTDPQAEYENIADELVITGRAIRSQMFSMPCLKYGSKAFAGFHHGAMVFKLTGQVHTDALALPGAHLFDPGGSGRLWREWVEVLATHSAHWPELGRSALEYLSGSG